MAIRVSELELTRGIRAIEGVAGYTEQHILVRLRGRPFGWARIPIDTDAHELPEETILAAISDQFGDALLPLVLEEHDAGTVPMRGLPSISVVICTRDRADVLAGCLRAVFAQDYADYEVIVVDNAPRTDATEQLVRTWPARYVPEHRPGLDWARNRGVTEARSEVVAFVDDDARPDPGWLRALATVFATSEAAAVTGLVAPFELETVSQARFELEYGGMGHGFARRVLRKRELSTDDLLWASGYGVGTNMAFRRELFTSVGLFDTALDVGTPSGGGGDVDMFHRVVTGGHTLVYEPAALVWHLHRRTPGALRRLVFNNGRSFGAYLITCARNGSVGRTAVFSFFARCWVRSWLLRRLIHPYGFPRHLILLELCGTLVSPVAYVLAQRYRQQVACVGTAQMPIQELGSAL